MNQPKPGASKIRQACGHFSVFVLKPNDRYAKDRLVKFMGLKCKDCREKDRIARERQEAETAVAEAAAKAAKAEQQVKLPPGTKIELERSTEGTWAGTLLATDIKVSDEARGIMVLVQKLAQAWQKKSEEQIAAKE